MSVSQYPSSILNRWVWIKGNSRGVRLYSLYCTVLPPDYEVSGSLMPQELLLEASDLRNKAFTSSSETDDINQLKELPDAEEQQVKVISSADKNGRLRRMVYGDETMFASEVNGMHVITDIADGILKRLVYDDEMRLIKKEYFTGITNTQGIVLAKMTAIHYQEDSILPYESFAHDYSKNSTRTLRYNDKGRVSYFLDTHTQEDETLKDKETFYSYDDEDRLIQQDTTSWTYTQAKDKSLTVSKVNTSKKYQYTDDELPPSVSYYEDGELRVTTEYLTKESYKESLFFDGGFSVETLYEDGIKKKETVLLDGVEQRSRSFE